MGSIISFIRDLYFTITSAAKALADLRKQYQALLKRASSLPGLPVPDPTEPYWLDNPPFSDVPTVPPALPSEADIVIIGSGITGAAVAKAILDLSPSDALPRIVVCEARELCSGATGRNGGHIKSVPYDEFASLRCKLGEERARKIVRFQRRHLEVLMQLGGEIPEGEVREVETMDLFLEEWDFGKAQDDVDEMKQWLPEEKCRVWQASEAREQFGVNKHIAGAISYSAGALWPYRLVTGVWKSLTAKYPSLTISTRTAVATIGHDHSSPYPYEVTTSRGSLWSRHVVHATNGFASHLVPSLRGRLAGARGHMTAQRPGTKFPPSHGKRSWSVIYFPGFEYVTQRPDADDGTPGDLLIGGSFFRSKEEGLDQIGIWDDSRMDAFPLMHLRGSLQTVFEPNWGTEGELQKAWTGIMGFTGDTLPFVGRLPPAKTEPRNPTRGIEGTGQWVAAGFNGEGMVWAWLCGTALGVMLLGKENEELKPGIGRPGGTLVEWFPMDVLKIDKARLRRADLKNLAD